MALIALGSEITGPVVYVSDKKALESMAKNGKCSDTAIYAFPDDKGGTNPTYVYAIYDKNAKGIVYIPNDGHVSRYGSTPDVAGLWEKKYSSGYYYTSDGWKQTVRTASVSFTASSDVKNLEVTAYCICEAYYVLIIKCNYNTSSSYGNILTDLKIDEKLFYGKAFTSFSHNVDYSVNIQLESKVISYNHNVGAPPPQNGQPLVGTIFVRK